MRTALEPASDRSSASKITQCQKELLHKGRVCWLPWKSMSMWARLAGWPNFSAFDRAGMALCLIATHIFSIVPHSGRKQDADILKQHYLEKVLAVWQERLAAGQGTWPFLLQLISGQFSRVCSPVLHPECRPQNHDIFFTVNYILNTWTQVCHCLYKASYTAVFQVLYDFA